MPDDGVWRFSGSLEGLTASDLSALRALYEAAFPAHLRGPWPDLATEVEAGSTILWVLSDHGAAAGFAYGRPLGGSLPLFLEYMAVERGLSGRWLGSRLMWTLTGDVAAANGVVFEIEPPDEGDADERRERWARQRFYERLGAAPVDCASGYRVPASDSDATYALVLMWHGGTSNVGAPRGAQLTRVLQAIATEGYGVEAGSSGYAAIVGGQRC